MIAELGQINLEEKASAWKSAPGVCGALQPEVDFGGVFGLLSRGISSGRLQRGSI
jgi:hypothetical protein